MGLKVTGMQEWRDTLRSVPERAPEAFRKVGERAGVQIKKDWRARWRAISVEGHIPHLIRGVGYDLTKRGAAGFRLEVGVDPKNRQAFLSKIITYGTLTSAPHDAGQAALDVEMPKFQNAVGKVAVDLLEGK